MRYALFIALLIAAPAFARAQSAPPVAGADSCATVQDTAVICPDPLANDSAPDGGQVFYVYGVDMATGGRLESLVSPTEAGGVFERTAAGLRYTPPPGFVGRDRTTYRIETMNGGQATGAIEIAVTCR